MVNSMTEGGYSNIHASRGMGIMMIPRAKVGRLTKASKAKVAKLKGMAGMGMSAQYTPTVVAAPLPPRNFM